MRLKVATVCSGIGSPEVAIEELGIDHEIVFACEIDKFARASYQTRFTPNMMLTDMTKEEWRGPEFYSDLFIGGIPCQAFSLAGKRLGELDPRGLLFFDFFRYVKNQQPKVCIIENVKGLLSDNGGKTFQNWIQLLGRSLNQQPFMFHHPDSLGYNLHFKVLNSKDFGVPQNRERVFLIGIRNDLPNDFNFPIGEPLKLRLKDVLEPVVDEKYYLSEKALEYLIRGQERGRDSVKITDGSDCSSTITANYSKGVHNMGETYIQEPVGASLRGRNPGGKIQSGYTNEIIEDIADEINNKEGLTLFGNSQDFKLSPLNGVSQTLSAGHFNQPKIIVKEATQKGYAEAREGDSINLSNPNSPTRPRRVGSHIANTLDTACNQAVVVSDNIELNQIGNLYENGADSGRVYDENGLSCTLKSEGGGGGAKTGLYCVKNRIRRLTPLECWRLQGFPDDYFALAKEVNSDSQIYKQAGNSMTSTVMKAIIKNLLPVLNYQSINVA